MTARRLFSIGIVLNVVALAILLWTSEVVACDLGPTQQDFRWELAEDAFPQPNGMLLIAYEDPASHRTTHVTYHRIRQVFQKPVLAPVSHTAADETLVEVDGSLSPLIYVIVSAPLYYGTDVDEMGLPRRMWLDSEEDGLNGNEESIEISVTTMSASARPSSKSGS
jgi:hypothetical protein